MKVLHDARKYLRPTQLGCWNCKSMLLVEPKDLGYSRHYDNLVRHPPGVYHPWLCCLCGCTNYAKPEAVFR